MPEWNEWKTCGAYTDLAENCSREPSDDSAPKAYCELRSGTEVAPRLLRHVAERDFVAELIDGELSDGIRNLSGKAGQSHPVYLAPQRLGGAHLQRIGRNPANNPATPSSRARRANPVTRPVA